jgi:hypothetical protein
MKKIKVLRDAIITSTKIIWNVPVEYDGNKYVILVNQDDNGDDVIIYYYDKDKRYFAGEEVQGYLAEQLHEEIIENMYDAGIMYSGVEEGEEVIAVDDDEE